MNLKVLVLDDEIFVQIALKEMLSHLGHEATVVSTGKEALAAYALALASDRSFDVAILDLNLNVGEMDGCETAAGIFEIDSQARLILSTGGVSDMISANLSKYGFVASLCKPYRMEQLRAALNTLHEHNETSRSRAIYPLCSRRSMTPPMVARS